MKSIACRDMGMDCDFVATGESADEAVSMLNEHGMSAHGMTEEQLMEKKDMAMSMMKDM